MQHNLFLVVFSTVRVLPVERAHFHVIVKHTSYFLFIDQIDYTVNNLKTVK